MKKLLILCCVVLFVGCKKSPKPPKAAQLVYPLQNSECTTGVDVANTDKSEVEFKWDASSRTDFYELKVTNLSTNLTQTLITGQTSLKVALDKGLAYSWFVTSKSDELSETAASTIWKFYNAGVETTYPPFPSELLAPKSGQTVFKDLNNEIKLEWSGADVDDDLLEFKVYFSNTMPPTVLVATNSPENTETTVSVTADTIYYWKVIATDVAGNSSDSGIYEFKVR